MADSEIVPVLLGTSAITYCRRVVESHSAFGAPLQSRLLLDNCQAPFAYLPEENSERASADFDAGEIANAKTDETLVRFLCQWTGASDRKDQGRLLLFEDMFAKRSDPSEPLRFDRYFADWMYSVSPEAPTMDDLDQVIAGTASYPAVGVLSTPGLSTCSAVEFSEHDLDEIANSAVALLVRAWDDEAFMTIPLVDDFSYGPAQQPATGTDSRG